MCLLPDQSLRPRKCPELIGLGVDHIPTPEPISVKGAWLRAEPNLGLEVGTSEAQDHPVVRTSELKGRRL